MTIQETLALSAEQRRAAYAVVNGTGNRNDVDISSVWIKASKSTKTYSDITDDFTEQDKFTNYGTYSFVWQKTLKESPERADNGALPQLLDMPYFITGNLKIDFEVMSIDDYRRIMKLIYTGNNCYKVKTYDIVFDRMIIIEMYFQPEEMPKIFTMAERLHGVGASSEEWTDLIGVQSHTVQMVGTGNDDAQQRYFG
ncbi:MAG: hypothetical protein NC131_01085 [Roseburia sp.]|nr:hypothetical protein [Roseburia sp.]